jgi:16S rRNA (cytosine967-C5)-methyltransferase
LNNRKPREIALRVLLAARENAYVEDALDQELAANPMPTVDRGLCRELAFGVVRWRATLDWLITRMADGREPRPDLREILRLGFYQIFWLTRIPDHAIVNETVALARFGGFEAQAGFVNAMLRRGLRERDHTSIALEELKETDPATGWSHPAWLVERWERTLGSESTHNLLRWDNSPPPTFARINTHRTTSADLEAAWTAEKVKFLKREFPWTGPDVVYELISHPSLATMPSFQQGGFYLQDPSTLFAVEELAPQPGETILDACAAPGGKSTYIAQKMQNRGRIVAEDADKTRLGLIRENYQRLGLTCIDAAVTPAKPLPATAGNLHGFDRILVDAPCSNSGVLRRRIQLRWRIRPEEIARLRQTQLDILRLHAPRLKPGGVLVYSTCSLEKEENRDVVEAFVAENPEFTLQRDRQLTPFQDQVDGAYVARLKKVE